MTKETEWLNIHPLLHPHMDCHMFNDDQIGEINRILEEQRRDYEILVNTILDTRKKDLTDQTTELKKIIEGKRKDTTTGRENGFCRCGVSIYECGCYDYNKALQDIVDELSQELKITKLISFRKIGF